MLIGEDPFADTPFATPAEAIDVQYWNEIALPGTVWTEIEVLEVEVNEV